MSQAGWFAVGQTIAFLSVCGFAIWSARVIAEAADNSVRAAEDAARAAADIREMRDALRAWLDQERDRAARPEQVPPRTATDTAEAQALLTPQAIIERGDVAEVRPDTGRTSRGRHAQPPSSPWTAALRAAASRGGRDR